ncbi:3-hydroxyacyl-CoA dehydrogenase/enoyl-CoA hydratase family protein [Bacillus thermotolerans]|uniref:3-hydroxyacyl-CoA dehydrogenase/enoyl-CoA hydratase family protein n=1 Tax=Bacillus thermotolerans TaxID=1221996 RepID=UPI000580678A|nr:3-hydroxyacyl-CoA dehydrogenase/enoyl-CoA hydratase family protein [Bacillus thermotolerans]KKB34220.1 Enoyl-CoA hydratase [Bacillus thermotolerans]
MVQPIQKAAVLGSGVMGSGIAAHLANVGIPTLLLDIVPGELTGEEKAKGLTLEDKQVRNRLAEGALKKLMRQKPAPLTSKANIQLIIAGNLEDDLEKLKDVDWIIEVVVERIDVKRQLFEQVEAHRKAGSIVSSNTSGLSVEAMIEGRSEEFKRHFLGTHFFNPPRYLKLLEIIPTKYTDEEVLEYMKTFGEDALGKGVVIAKDTPNFIANRIGTYGLLKAVQEMQNFGLSAGEIDSITGPLIGRPKSATFRTLDVVGLDTFIHVANNVYEQAKGEEKEVFRVPEFMLQMRQNGWIGAKSGQGFFKKEGKTITELNPKTMEYGERRKLKTASTEMAKQQRGTKAKLKTLLYADDQAGTFLWKTIAPVLLYAAEHVGKIADDLVSIDQAMKWGFGWELGPFEMWDAIGVETALERMKRDGRAVPIWVKEMVESGHSSFYQEEEEGRSFYYNGRYERVPVNEKVIDIKRLKKQGKVLKSNSGASLIDIGDGIVLLEFHSPNNAIGLDIVQMINYAVEETEKNYKGLVIGNQGKHFCVGANLAMILMEVQDDNLWEVDMIVKAFQQAMMKIKYSQKPVVAAPFSMTLGGGAEVCLPAAHIQASSETYMGLVETGVGLIPGGGGNKELYIKHLEQMANGVSYDLQEVANKVFETIAMAKTSTSAAEARENNFLSKTDAITFNEDHLLYDAKQAALHLYKSGYRAPVKKKIPVVGETGYAALLLGARAMVQSGYISEHDFKIASKLAYVIAGGKVPFGTEVEEEYLLNLEREAFLSLIEETKSQQRMQHMLINGKPLRN